LKKSAEFLYQGAEILLYQARTLLTVPGQTIDQTMGFCVLLIRKSKWHNYCKILHAMDTQKVKTCFTITFTDEQYNRAKGYVEDMKRHPHRIFWQGKQGKTDDELIIEQIAHRILSGFYNNEPYVAGKHIMRMDSSVALQ
jgi:hypothetical protein